MSVRFSRMLGRTSEHSTEDGFKWKFRDILAQNYIIWMICTMLAVKHFFLPMQSRYSGKIFQLRVQMLDSHDNDVPMKCMIAMMVQHKDWVFHAWAKWCIWHTAIATMLAQWCIHHDARMTMLSMYACMRCISMMRTCMSWWCTWFIPRNRSLMTNTLLALYPRGSINK